jgi:ATP synthase protein I
VANTEKGRGEDEAALRARLNTLSSQIDAQRKKPSVDAPHESAGPDRGWGRAMSLGLRVVAELVAGIVVGGGIGYLLDKWLSTTPFLLIAFLLLGTAGGFWNVIRATSRPFSGPPR